MTYKTFVSSRSQVTVALMLGVYLTIASRSHFNQMLVDATGGRHQVYSAMNVVYQVAYASVQVPASLYADHVDPVPALAIVPLALATTSVVAPFALSYIDWTASSSLSIGSAVAIGALFAVNGASLGAWWPFMNIMVSNWAPPDKLAVMYGTINTGLPGGIALGNAFSGFAYSVHDSTFRYSFFVVSAVCALWSAIWLHAVYRFPADDPGVRPDELEHLTAAIRPKVQLPVPWRSIVTSVPVWSVMVANYGSTVFYTVLIMYMPVYLKETLMVAIARNGFLSTLPSLGQMVVLWWSGWFASTVHTRQWTGVTNIRKILTAVGMLAPALVLLTAVAVFADRYAFYGALVLAYALSGAVFSGFRVSQMEMAPNFVAAVTSVCDAIGSLAMNSTHVAFIVAFGNTADQATWNGICLGLSSVLVACACPFLLAGSSDVQPWNDGPAASGETSRSRA